jgi:[ribosomal protein S5]-alanine N-acetyltransferase
MSVHFPIKIETPRLLLREMSLEDAEPIWEYGQNPVHRRYEPEPPRTIEEFQDIMKWLVSTQVQIPRTFYYIAVTLKNQNSVPIGGVHITIRDEEHRQAEVGYSFNSHLWGRGYCTEASRHMVNFAFTQLNMHRVFATGIVQENTASWRVAEKLGMRKEGMFQESLFFGGRWWNTLAYGITKSEWVFNDSARTE